ncbi:hypothetical protein BFP72_08920 [Reichenbachiella sp. 5M10]|nr:hypothetical protein BFP72_08920 [Reichenbachiella sp. 5M10]
MTFACDGVEQYRKPIEDLSTDWQDLVLETTELSEGVAEEIKSWQGMYHSMYANESNIEDEQPQEVLDEMNELKKACLGHGDVYVEIQEVLDGRFKTIETKGIDIQELMLGLETGKLPEDVGGRIDSLSQYLDEARASVADWKDLMKTTKAACSATCQEYVYLTTSLDK